MSRKMTGGRKAGGVEMDFGHRWEGKRGNGFPEGRDGWDNGN